ncbi:MAG: sulfotransferase domain-containing protein [Paracoccaceae bacterium]|nr:sulfotransferase domain-containing protein [Paracoccaceae bacterium]
MTDQPKFEHVYQNHHIDSSRWDDFSPRDDDVVIATSYKAGTTWTQAIVANLLFENGAFPAPVWEMSPWLDFRCQPHAEVKAALGGQSHRRFVKTHLPLNSLKFFPQLKYIFISRDGRDVFMSMWNHYSNYLPDSIELFNGPIDGVPRPGPEFPVAPDDIHECWRNWCTRGSFDWETDGWPFWSHLSVTQSWWNYRHLPNVLTLHYGDMKADTLGAVARIADFLEVPITPKRLAQVAEAVSIDTMRPKGATYAPRGGAAWKGGSDTFLNKGTNRRWEGILSAEELALYDQACERTLSPDCREWLERGGVV